MIRVHSGDSSAHLTYPIFGSEEIGRRVTDRLTDVRASARLRGIDEHRDGACLFTTLSDSLKYKAIFRGRVWDQREEQLCR
jgi:hypothetical protein